MKRAEFILNLISLPVDAITLAGAGLIAYYIRYNLERFDLVGPVIFDLSLSGFIAILIRVIPFLLIIFAFLGLYNVRATQPFRQQATKIFVGVSLGALFTIVLFFFDQSIFPSRFIILAAWMMGIIFAIGGRLVLRIFKRIMFHHNYGLQRLIIINGQGSETETVESLFKSKRYGYQVVAKFDHHDEILFELETFIDANPVDEIIQTNTSITREQNMHIATLARSKGLSFSFIPSLFEVQRNVIELQTYRGVPLISLKHTPLDGWGRVVKRVSDVIFSSICIIITLPVFLGIALAIKLNSPGPVFYNVTRVGRGRNFTFFKFRSMYTHLSVGEKYGNSEAQQTLEKLLNEINEDNRTGPLYKIKNDPRVTPVGRFLRKTKLDELPQFWNVLLGDMSMVGPRPHFPDQVSEYKRGNERIFSIKPGIFGLTQLAQLSWPNLPFKEEIKLDTYYLENWSWWLDLSILIRSFVALVFSRRSNDDY
ncbi:sugar transferase [bacterium]|nr:MAG: sugar transferase [bacterium]